jgi:hypothetical protein
MSCLCPNLMIEEPDLYDEADIFCAVTKKFILNSSDYYIISSVHNSLVGHSGLERTLKRLTFKLLGSFLSKRSRDLLVSALVVRKYLS